jgi:lipid A 3-O-deacylase
MLKLSEDNDFINIHFSGSDKAYTHGFRAELLYTKKEGKSAFGDRLMLEAGEKSANTFGWGITQTMVTPSDLSNPAVKPSDYRYACSITILRTRHSSNPVKKYSLQTEYVVGVLGPIALGKETQVAMHKLIHDEMPRGWNTQLKTAVLLNINLTAEKQLLSADKSIECIGGVKSFMGTSLTALSVYTLLRIGKMNPYFSGYLPQYMQHSKRTKSWQLYAIVRPSLDFVFRNAHVQGGTFRPQRTDMNQNVEAFRPEPPQRLNPIGYALDYGLVFTLKQVSITFTQRDLYAMIKEQTRHEVGNISIYVAL